MKMRWEEEHYTSGPPELKRDSSAACSGSVILVVLMRPKTRTKKVKSSCGLVLSRGCDFYVARLQTLKY